MAARIVATAPGRKKPLAARTKGISPAAVPVAMAIERLVHVAYASAATEDFSSQSVADLLARARSTNEALGVTGMLLLVERSFFQILEGAPDVVEPLYAKIGLDRRHNRIVKLIFEPIEARDFRDWSMGLARVTSDELRALPGFSDFFRTRRTLDELGKGRTRTLLNAFREGRWRARVG
jgi:hypothetical protein